MIRKYIRTLIVPIALSLAASGCFVATSRFEEKVAESDTLRDALASANKEKNALSIRHESLQKQLADTKETADSCAVKSKGQEAELSRLRHEADDIICLRTPEPFDAVGLWYDDFTQTSDEEVHRLLAR